MYSIKKVISGVVSAIICVAFIIAVIIVVTKSKSGDSSCRKSKPPKLPGNVTISSEKYEKDGKAEIRYICTLVKSVQDHVKEEKGFFVNTCLKGVWNYGLQKLPNCILSIDGGYSLWVHGDCSVTCGNGTRTNTRKCDNPEPDNGGNSCEGIGPALRELPCFEVSCPIHGGYGPWISGECSVTCGNGVRSDTRNCNNPKPESGGKGCVEIGPETKEVPCQKDPLCPIDGGYTPWTMGECSATCGDGTRSNSRKCTNPKPSNGGNNCDGIGSKTQKVHCHDVPCPTNGDYGPWISSGCSMTCGNGTRLYTRECNNPEPKNGGDGCDDMGPATKNEVCDKGKCPVNGGYGTWKAGKCSVTCGNGTQTNTRECNNPKPQGGGDKCDVIGNSTKEFPCNDLLCPIDGGYSHWEDGDCSVTCGDGIRIDSRDCTNPEPEHGGSGCDAIGPATREQPCEKGPCPVDGGYGPWITGECSVTCGDGRRVNSRNCTNPKPKDGGDTCDELGPATKEISCTGGPCPINGGYSLWTVGECSITCGQGMRPFTRRCNNPKPKHGGDGCDSIGTTNKHESCHDVDCPVDGGYGPWISEGCSVTCDDGIQTNTRKCNNPKPEYGGESCSEIGPDTQTHSCNEGPCPVNGSFSLWMKGLCSVTCGKGIQINTRVCDNPRPQHGGNDCSKLGHVVEELDCKEGPCSVDGGYGPWITGDCSVTCGDGTRPNTRKCINPKPEHGGDGCEKIGPEMKEVPCNDVPCPLEAGYGVWTAGECSVTCDNGKQTNTRKCNLTKKAGGKSACHKIGPAVQTVECNKGPCPIDGAYGNWKEGQCSVTCGNGTKTKSRECNKPEPKYGGADCSVIGQATEEMSCMDKPCPVNGGYNPWITGECSVTCGGGTRTDIRQCNNPKPEHGGSKCDDIGPASKDLLCKNGRCPIDGAYGRWTEGECSTTCGKGIQINTRKCNDPEPEHGGDDCSVMGPASEEIPCKLGSCPVNGGFGPWMVGECSVTCDEGTITNSRECNNPAPENGGDSCNDIGPAKEDVACNEGPCPVDGGYSTWEFGPCSATCGNGSQTYTRECNNPKPEHGGQGCGDFGPTLKVVTCSDGPCPINGGYGPWIDGGKCSVTCGRGTKANTRKCINPKPKNGGVNCKKIGPEEKQVQCQHVPCPIDGGYSPWVPGDCSVTCGDGTRTDTRECSKPEPDHGGSTCDSFGPAMQEIPCNDRSCPVNGGYGIWIAGQCSATCGYGKRVNMRSCNNPKPEHGGDKCDIFGPASEKISCNEGPCPIDGGYGPWETGECSVTCDNGTRTNTRECNHPKPENGGDSCILIGSGTQRVPCKDTPCPVDGGFGPWVAGQCSVTCGEGKKTKSRECNNPEPQHDGDLCIEIGPPTEDVDCNDGPCPVNGGYSSWTFGECSVTCNNGTKTGTRKCNNPKPSLGGDNCDVIGPATQENKCENVRCRDSGSGDFYYFKA